MTRPAILVFAGSIRTGSLNEKLAVNAAEAIAAAGGAVTKVSLADFPMPIYNGDLEKDEGVPEPAQKLCALVTASQGIFIASPENNAGPSALLKNTIDWLSRIKPADGEPGPFKGRVYALGAASPGGLGGYRGLMQLRQSLELQLGTLLVPDMVSVPAAMNAFDESDRLIAERPAGMLKIVAERLIAMARTFAA